MFDLSQAWETIQRLGNGFMTMLPRFVLAVLMAWGFTFVGRLARDWSNVALRSSSRI